MTTERKQDPPVDPRTPRWRWHCFVCLVGGETSDRDRAALYCREHAREHQGDRSLAGPFSRNLVFAVWPV